MYHDCTCHLNNIPTGLWTVILYSTRMHIIQGGFILQCKYSTYNLPRRMHLALVSRPSPHSTHISSLSHLISSQLTGGRALRLRGHSIGIQVATGSLLRLISRSMTSLHWYPGSQSISSHRLAMRMGGGRATRVGSSPVNPGLAGGRGGSVRGGGGST